jgi:hypothetical protein
VCADKNNAVPGGISRVPFQLLIGDRDFGAVRDFALTVRDNRDVMVLIDLEEISFVSVGLTATWSVGIVGRRSGEPYGCEPWSPSERFWLRSIRA